MSYHQIVEPHHRLTFASTVELVSQQTRNVLRDCVTMVPASGEAHSIADLIDAIETTGDDEAYSMTNPEVVANNSRRWLVNGDGISTGQTITKKEQFDKVMDPTSKLSQNHIQNIERRLQDRILGVKRMSDGSFKVDGGGILGKVYEGKTPTTAVDLPVGNYIAVDVGHTAATGLNAEKLRAATEAMELADFGMDTDDEVYALITPKQKTDLINLALATKTSLNPFDIENIREGKPGRLLGVNWRFTNRLPKDASGYRLIPVWTKSNIVAGVWQDVKGDMWNQTSKRNLPYIFVDAYIEAGRVEDKGVRVIRCAEA